MRGPAAGGGWTASSTIAGPLRPRNGLTIRYTDTLGLTTATPSAVATVEVAVHGVAAKAHAPGLVRDDSLTARIAVRRP